MSDLVILDLGYGNTRSVALAFERLDVVSTLSADPEIVSSACRLVLPGVGAACEAMRRLRDCRLVDAVRTRTRPTLGICLGMQLLFERSQENGGTDLLAILPGSVTALAPKPGCPVPHMGWTALDEADASVRLKPGDYLYFAHSYVCPDGPSVVARARYGGSAVPAVVRSGPFWGAQFHPERSSAAGSSFLTAFLRS